MHHKRNGWAPILLALALTAGTAGAAAAIQDQDQGADRGPGRRPHGGMMMDQRPGGMHGGLGMGLAMCLDLTADQKDKLKADRLARGKRLINLKAEAQTIRLELREAEQDDPVDLGKIESLANKLGQVKAKMIVERAKGRKFFLGLLTPEQKKDLDEGRGRGPCGTGLRAHGDGPDDED